MHADTFPVHLRRAVQQEKLRMAMGVLAGVPALAGLSHFDSAQPAETGTPALAQPAEAGTPALARPAEAGTPALARPAEAGTPTWANHSDSISSAARPKASSKP